MSAATLLGALLSLAIAGVSNAADTLLPGFSEQSVGSGWIQPVGITFDPSALGRNRVYVWERPGRVWLVENGVKAATPLLDLREEVGAYGDFGLLGFALDPNFQTNGHLYCLYAVDRHYLLHFGTPSYSATASEPNAATIGRLTRYTARVSDGFRSVDPASRRVLVGETASTGFPILHVSHGPGSLVFGTDGTLLASFGSGASFEAMDDGGNAGNSYGVQALADGIISAKEDVGSFRSQLVDSLSGKVIRIDPATGNGVPGNPFFDAAKPRAARSRVWALGLRNPFRFTIQPGTGSHLPAEGNPGVIVLGDVGEGLHEETNVIDRPGQNFGWPLYEGLNATVLYGQSSAQNLDAPNPLGGYFKFRDLIVQETLAGPSWPNPLNAALQVPATLPRFMHARPILEVGHGESPPGPARTGIFKGTTAAEIEVGALGSPVSGAQFGGDCSVGGCFYTGANFPVSYVGSYFFADYSHNWIKNMVLDANRRPTRIADFAGGTHPSCLAVEPVSGALYYVNVIDSTIWKIIYAPGGNLAPSAAAAANLKIGASPLSVTFSSAGSADPDGLPLHYLWDFGDGTSSAVANPVHSFTAAGTKRFDVKLTVTDAGGATAVANVSIFVNHTLPTVDVVSPIDATKYLLTGETPYLLQRRVQEVAGHPTTTQWDIALHHNEHEHPEAPVIAPAARMIASPVWSAVESYYYHLRLTVTDDLGASVQREVRLFPNAENVPPQVAWSASQRRFLTAPTPQILDPAATASDADSPGIELGQLRFVVTGGSAGDVLSVVSEGTAGPVGSSGANVTYQGVVIASRSGGANGQSLAITFNEAATPAMAKAVLRRVGATFADLGTRVVTATFSDGDGGTSSGAALTCTLDPPVVAFTSASYVVDEAGGSARLTVARSGSLTLPVWVAYATSDGSAVAGVDYQADSETLYLAPGQASATFLIPILPDTVGESDETFTVTLQKVSGGAVLAAPGVATVTIKNNSSPALQFAADSYRANENDGTAAITVTRMGNALPAVSVRYATGGGTAMPGTDYTATSGVLNFAAGETSARFNIAVIDNSTIGPGKTVGLTLSAPSSGAILGAGGTATLTIVDDENAGGVIQFTPSTNAFVNEGDGSVILAIARSGSSAKAVSANYRTWSGTAIAGADFTAASGTIDFASGQTIAYLTMPILNDSSDEPEEAFQVRLSTGSGGASIGVRNAMTVHILNDDSAGGLVQFAGDVTVHEYAKSVRLTVVRQGASSRAITVNYNTADITAKAGSDYVGMSGTLVFDPGVTSRTIRVSLRDDFGREPTETFGVRLSSPTGGAVIGSSAWSVVTILDNDSF